MKQKLDKRFTENYDQLVIIATRIVRAYRLDDDEHLELVQELYLKMSDNLNNKNVKLCLRTNKDFIKFTARYMKLLKMGKWSVHCKNYSGFLTISFDVQDEKQQEEILIQAEDIDQQTKDFIIDLNSNDIPTKRGYQYLKAKEVLSELTLPETLLCREAIFNNKSGRQIAREQTQKMGFAIPHNGICSEIKELKEKLKNKIT